MITEKQIKEAIKEIETKIESLLISIGKDRDIYIQIKSPDGGVEDLTLNNWGIEDPNWNSSNC
jgi:hypothetical protein